MQQNQEETYQKRILTVPNILSFVRLCLIPVIVWLYCGAENYRWAAIAVGISGLTDVVDGYIARHFHMVSDLGKILDPVADKLTQLATLLCLVTRFPHMVVPFAILAVKELMAAVMGIIAIRKTGAVEGAVWHGKVCTVLLYAMMLLHLLWGQIPAGVSYATVSLCTGMMLVSAVLYAIRNFRAIRRAGKTETQAA